MLLVIPSREAPSFMSQSRILIEQVSSIDRFRRECRQVTFQVAKERISIAVKYLCTLKKKRSPIIFCFEQYISVMGSANEESSFHRVNFYSFYKKGVFF